MRRSHLRLLVMFAFLPLVVAGMASLYMLGMIHLEGQPRSFGAALEWAAETLTSTGYGKDAEWQHPLMIGFVVVSQFMGVFLIFLVVPVFLIPFVEERFEGRLPRAFPRKLEGHVIIYRYGATVESLMAALDDAGVPVLVLEEDINVARRLRDRRLRVVYAELDQDNIDFSRLVEARALVTNGSDDHNAVIASSAREHGFVGPIIALVETPAHRKPMLIAGADTAFTPSHMLAAAIAAKASVKLSPRVAGAQSLGRYLTVAELRVQKKSSLAGKTLIEAKIREKTGATIVGQWVGGRLEAQPGPDQPIEAGSILLAAGSQDSIGRLGDMAQPIASEGPILVLGCGNVGHKVVELLEAVGEDVRVVDQRPGEQVDLVGDALDRKILERAGLDQACAVILTLGSDSTAMFAATVVRDARPDVPIIASVTRVEQIARIHRMGADFALSMSQIAGQILARQLIGEDYLAIEGTIRLVKVAPAGLVGQNPILQRVRERTGCSIVAVERGDEVIVDFGAEFRIRADDALYICGDRDAMDSYFDVYPDARTTRAS